jgi:hypothetical protein
MLACGLALGLWPGTSANAQNQDGATPIATPTASQAAKPAPPTTKETKEESITEDELKQQLQGKTLYLRGGYLDNNLSFDEHGRLIGHSPQGSYTLCLLQIDKVSLSKHKLELTGTRFGLHFLGTLPNEDPTKASDKVRVTPKKKSVKVTIDRELVVTPKKKKVKGEDNDSTTAVASGDGATGDGVDKAAESSAAVTEPESERSADPGSVTTTTSPAHAAHLLREAVDTVLAPNLDDRMVAAMPTFWKLYYQAAAAQSDYRPSDPSVLRQNSVDEKAKILTAFEPPSNDYAQACGIVGMALYHVVIGVDGKPQEIVVGRPIGFGLDENAADSIRKASFAAAIKDGKPVPVMLDVVVQFRIYSKRTDRPAVAASDEASNDQKLPGPYSVVHP